MALRLLLYITRVLEKAIKGKSLYSGKSLPIPWLEFYVLYNGVKPYPDKDILRLSDLYEKPKKLGLPEKPFPPLELEVKVININEGRNIDIVNRCKKLAEYSAFMARRYDFWKEFGDKETALKETVKYCQKNDILKEFLEVHASEVLNMLLEEWNLEDAKAVWYEEAREDGLAEGRAEGRAEGHAEGHAEGFCQGQQHVLELLSQGLSVDEVKQRLAENK